MGRLDNKVVLITGGARGQGAAEAAMFVREGAKVVIGDVLDEEGQVLAKSLGDAAAYVHHDITSEDDWAAAVGRATEGFGALDVLVNNAGVFRFTPIKTTTPDEFMSIVRVNQLGTFLGIQAAARAMKGRGGSIVNISSVTGLRGGPGTLAYSATKFAIRGMTKVAAFELAALGIRVNSVHPGFIDTPMLDGVLGSPDEAVKTAVGSQVPVGALSTPEDIANMVLFLASDESRHCTGAEFVVDGGLTAGLSLNNQAVASR